MFKRLIQWVCLWVLNLFEKKVSEDITLNVPAPAAPGEALATSAIGLVATLAKGTEEVYTTENDPSHEKAAIEQHAQAAIDTLNAAIQKAATGTPDEKAAALDQIRRMAQ